MQSVRRLVASPVAHPTSLVGLREKGPRKAARRAGRRQVYLGEGLTVRVTAGRDGVEGDVVEGEIIDISARGFGIAMMAGKGLPKQGEIVTIEHTGPATSGVAQQARVVSVSEGRFGGRLLPRLGVTFLSERTTQRSARDRREADRYACDDAMTPTATALSPLFYREHLHLSVVELGAGGMTASTSLRTTAIFPGMSLSFNLTLPAIGAFEVRGVVTDIRHEVGDESFVIGVQWHEPSRDVLQAMAEYLLVTHEELTPSRLREGGLSIGTIERAVKYDYANLSTDYQDILALRLRAHQREGRLGGVTKEDMTSSFDGHARHLVCRFGGRLVGYVRVVYVDGDTRRSEYVSKGGHQLPDWLWKAGFVEGGAGAIDPEFQRAGLFVPLIQHSARVALQSGARYLVGGCGDELLETYKQMGFSVLETREVEPKPGWKFRSHLILLDLANVPDGGKFTSAMATVVTFVESSRRAPSVRRHRRSVLSAARGRFRSSASRRRPRCP
jgi:hypothetical protein